MTDREQPLGMESPQPTPLRARGESPRAAVTAASPPEAAAVALEQRIAELERDLARMRGREERWRTERSQLLEALDAAEAELAELPALRRELQDTRDTGYWLTVVQSSLSWRLTRPLRALSRLGGRLRGRSSGS
jgi:hypothetical protein